MNALIAAVFAASVAVTSAAENPLTGEWKVRNDIASNVSEMTCSFTQKGEELTGGCATEQGNVEIAGKVVETSVSLGLQVRLQRRPDHADLQGVARHRRSAGGRRDGGGVQRHRRIHRDAGQAGSEVARSAARAAAVSASFFLYTTRIPSAKWGVRSPPFTSEGFVCASVCRCGCVPGYVCWSSVQEAPRHNRRWPRLPAWSETAVARCLPRPLWSSPMSGPASASPRGRTPTASTPSPAFARASTR